ncbi:molybdate ABC transporter substrate-binding protein [Nocardioides aequoreus]|uniref:molybdate ABC transporter substrate-binding protein n=1 Tax=Nocardioides aequoreus TaxID=397278 RepID=UPI00056A072D|nr:molybdate ABC transporter substrate-binding protein [Nocardioides aequoreus]
MRRALAVLSLSLSLLLPLAACASAGSQDEQTLRVFAAASLTESFESLAESFEAEHDGVTVELNLGPSSGLAEQIASGAPADVFASASPTNMQDLRDDGLVTEAVDFATNSLEIAVPPGNPGGVASVEDLADPEVKVAVCEADVPCGVVAAEVLDQAGLDVAPVTEEVDVKSVLTKVTLDEVDAGLVYVSDVVAAGDDVEGVEIPAELNSATTYPIAALEDAADPDLAREWVDLVTSEQGQRVLRDAGFGAP